MQVSILRMTISPSLLSRRFKARLLLEDRSRRLGDRLVAEFQLMGAHKSRLRKAKGGPENHTQETLVKRDWKWRIPRGYKWPPPQGERAASNRGPGFARIDGSRARDAVGDAGHEEPDESEDRNEASREKGIGPDRVPRIPNVGRFFLEVFRIENLIELGEVGVVPIEGGSHSLSIQVVEGVAVENVENSPGLCLTGEDGGIGLHVPVRGGAEEAFLPTIQGVGKGDEEACYEKTSNDPHHRDRPDSFEEILKVEGSPSQSKGKEEGGGESGGRHGEKKGAGDGEQHGREEGPRRK